MNRYDLINAINHLKPGSEFTFKNDDYSTIQWVVLNGDAPTIEEITEAIATVKQIETAAAAEKAAEKAALLAQLGITEDQAKLLLL